MQLLLFRGRAWIVPFTKYTTYVRSEKESPNTIDWLKPQQQTTEKAHEHLGSRVGRKGRGRGSAQPSTLSRRNRRSTRRQPCRLTASSSPSPPEGRPRLESILERVNLQTIMVARPLTDSTSKQHCCPWVVGDKMALATSKETENRPKKTTPCNAKVF